MSRCALILAGLSLGFAPAPFPKPDPTKAELKRMQGDWVRVKFVSNKHVITESLQSTTVVIADDRFTYSGPSQATHQWVITVDAKQKPKVLDMKGLVGNEKGLTYWGIYRLEGDTLTVHSRKGASESVRPADFTGAGSNITIEIFKRRKR